MVVVVGAGAVVVVVGAAVVVVVFGAAVVVVTAVVGVVVGPVVDVGSTDVVGVTVVVGHPGPVPCEQAGLDVLTRGTVVVVNPQGLAPAPAVHAVVVVVGAGRDVLVVEDVLVGAVVVVVFGTPLVVFVVLVVVVVLVVLVGLVGLVVSVVLVVVVVVLDVGGTGTGAGLVDALAGSPRYTQEMSTVGNGHPAGQTNCTGNAAAATSGRLTLQLALLPAVADTRQSVPAGSPVPW